MFCSWYCYRLIALELKGTIIIASALWRKFRVQPKLVPAKAVLYPGKRALWSRDDVTFRNVTVASENKPHPLTLGTASQIGAIPTEGVPFLLKILLPSNCTGLPAMYIRDLLLNPPTYATASTIQAIGKLMSNISCSIPEFTCIAPSKLVKLLELRETNHVEFYKIKNVLDEILQLRRNSELNEILMLLVDPTWVATWLKVDIEIILLIRA